MVINRTEFVKHEVGCTLFLLIIYRLVRVIIDYFIIVIALLKSDTHKIKLSNLHFDYNKIKLKGFFYFN